MLRRLITLSIACALLVACQSSAPQNLLPQNAANGVMPMPRNGPATNPNELPEPPVVRSANGIARVKLDVTFSGATGFPQFVFDGMAGVAPTIRVKPGDTIIMDLKDDLTRVNAGDSHDINIHFHGIGSSPLAPGDDVLGTLARPGQKIRYVIHIPATQGPGLYWYHPHIHGQTNYQVGQGGMSGAIVVEGLQQHFPQLAHMRERVIILRDTGIGANAPPDDEPSGNGDTAGMGAMSDMGSAQDMAKPNTVNSDPCGPEIGLTPALNGAVDPTITIAPGEKQFFRVINATGHKTAKLAVPGEKLTVLAVDGFAVDSYPGTKPIVENSVIIPVAARAEFIVTGPSKATPFRSLCFDSGSGGDRDPDVVLATIQPRSGSRTHARPAPQYGPITTGAPLPQSGYTTALPKPSAHRFVVFSEGNKHFFINGKAFKMSDPPMFVVHTGTVEEWHISNVSTEIHDFHIHQIHFLVIKRNGVPVAHPYWQDSAIIPHRQSPHTPGSLVVLMDFRDPVIKGIFLFHCHILDHEDAGMMAKIQAI